MQKEKIAIFSNIVIALTKIQSAVNILKATGDLANAIIPIAASVLLVLSSILIWRKNKYGPLISIVVIAFFIIQFFLLGLVQKLIVYFAIHVLALGSNVAVLKSKKSEHMDDRIRTHDEKGKPIFWKCPQCESENPNDSFACKNCGYNLT